MIQLLLVLVSIMLLIRVNRQDKRLQQLERTLEHLKPQHQAPSAPIQPAQPDGERSLPERPPAPEPATAKPPPSWPLQEPPKARSPHQRRPATWQSKGHRAWKQAERLFIENWSGILGVLVVVAGVTFVAINVALRLGPFHRFLLVAAAALALALPSVLIGRREPWRDLTTWMRSGGAALLLFACTASGGLPQLGLQWIASPREALAFIGLGVAVNLVLASIARTQAIASLHVVVNLLPLVIVPQTGLTLVIASLVAVVGAQLPLGRHWTRHLLVVSLAYGGYHISWFLRSQALLETGGSLRLAAALAAVLVFGSSAVLQQRSRLVAAEVKPLPLALQLSNWGALALALLVYPQQALPRAGALALAGLVVLALGLRARRRGQRWLHLSNVLVAQAFAVAAVLSLLPLVGNTLLVLLALLGECALFLGLGVVEDEATVRRIGWGLTALAGAALPLVGLARPLGVGDFGTGGELQNSLVLIGGAVLTTGVQGLIHRRALAVPQPSLLGWLVGAQAFVATAVAPVDTLRPLFALGMIGGLLLVARRLRAPGLLEGLAGAVLGLQIMEWIWLMASHPLAPKPLLAHLLPLAALALVLIWAARGTPFRLLGLDLLGLHAGLGAYLLLDPIAPQLPGVAWLMLALIALEAANQVRQEEALHTLVLAVGYLVAFAASFLLVTIQSPAYVALGGLTVRGRLLIELFSIAVAL